MRSELLLFRDTDKEWVKEGLDFELYSFYIFLGSINFFKNFKIRNFFLIAIKLGSKTFNYPSMIFFPIFVLMLGTRKKVRKKS